MQKPKTSPFSTVLNYYLFVMFTLFPLYITITVSEVFPFIHTDDGFIGIRHQKYYFFVVMTILVLIAAVLLQLTRKHEKPKLGEKHRFLRSMRFTDWAVLAFLLTCVISTVFSSYPAMAFWGETRTIGNTTQGRNNGLFLILLYVGIYFLITRCFRFAEYVFTGMAVGCGIVYLLTVLNGYYIDPLGMFWQFTQNETIYTEFFSTIGNKNMLSGFICVTLPVIFCMSAYTPNRVSRIIYLVSLALGSAALLIGDSDSGFLGITVFLAVYFVLNVRYPEKLLRYLTALSVFLGGICLLRFFSLLCGDNYKKLGDLSKWVLFSGFAVIAFAAAATFTAVLWLSMRKLGDRVFPPAVPIVIGSVFAAAAVGLFGVFLWFSCFDRQTSLGSLEKILRMSDAWGTHRGIMWLRSFEIFANASVYQKLFGTGPDTFFYAFEPYFGQLMKYGNTSTDAAHCEYINYLITIGVFGLGSYLAFLGGALTRGFQAAKRNPLTLVFASSIICYAVQAMLNIAVPISTPLLILFASLCEAAARQNETAAQV